MDDMPDEFTLTSDLVIPDATHWLAQAPEEPVDPEPEVPEEPTPEEP